MGCNLHVITSSSVRKKVSVVSFPGFARCVNWSRQSTLLMKENSLHHRAQNVNLSLLFFRQQLIMCVSNQTCQDGWTWVKFFFGVVLLTEKKFALFASGQNNATVWPVLKTSEGVNFIPVIFHCDESFYSHYHRTIRF